MVLWLARAVRQGPQMKGLWCSVVALLLFAGRASADDAQVLETRHRGVSAQNFALELRVALYQPQVDSDPVLHGNAPFAKTFGTAVGFEGAMELDWQAIHIRDIGTIGPGLSAGYYTVSGQATEVSTGAQSPETTTLQILPIYLVGVFRLDLFWRRLGIPLVPYAKAGIGYALWNASNSLATSVSQAGVIGEGHTWGTQLAAGVAFNVNVLDPTSALQLDEFTGINNTYVFAEYMLSTLNGIAQSDPLRVGSDGFVFGLTFEF